MSETVTIPKAHYKAFVALKEAVEYEEAHRSINGGMFLALEAIERTKPKTPDPYEVLEGIVGLLDWARDYDDKDTDDPLSLNRIADAWESSGDPTFYERIFADARTVLAAVERRGK